MIGDQFSFLESGNNEKNFWLLAMCNHTANAQTFSDGIALADVDGSGDYRLIIADEKKSMRVFSGMNDVLEVKLPCVPSGIATCVMPSFNARIPVVAIGVGSRVLMFGNNKPLYRYEIQPLPVDQEEKVIWKDLESGKTMVNEGVDKLLRRVEQGVKVTSRTLDFLFLHDTKEKEAFVTRNAEKPLTQLDTITCMSSIACSAKDSASCLVIGTEHRFLYMLDSSGCEVMKVEIPNTPAFLLTAGYTMEKYRIIAAARHGPIYSVKNGYLASHVIQPDGAVCGITRYDSQIVVATANNTVTYFSLKGKRHFTLYFSQPIRNIVTIKDSITEEARGVLVGLENGELQVYCGQILCHTSQLFSPAVSLRFGRYGREKSALVAVLKNGTVIVKFLHRNAQQLLQQRQQEVRVAVDKDAPIPVPHLSSIFRMQTEREKMHGTDMYRNFQYNLCRLRLLTDKKYIEMFCPGAWKTELLGNANLSISNLDANPIGKDSIQLPLLQQSPLRMSSTVQGMGPVFKIRINLECLSAIPLEELLLVCRYNTQVYHVPVPMVAIPCLLEGKEYTANVIVRLQDGESGGEPVTFSVLQGLYSQFPFQSLTLELPEKDFF